MIKRLSSCLLIVAVINSHAQNIDSILANPPVMELSISNPQPRLGEEFTISYNPAYIQLQLFKSVLGKLEPADDNDGSHDKEFKLAVKATKLGKETIGPLPFTINGVSCKTNVLSYEVVNPLPEVNEGLWIRKVSTGDNTFCIIMEQRIPVEAMKRKTAGNEVTYWNEPVDRNQVKINYTRTIEGVRSHTSSTATSEKYLYTKEGKRLDFQLIFSMANYEIDDPSANVELTKDWFINLPPSYKFNNTQ